MLRLLAYFRFRFDSDEPQHLHVAWGWANGLVQYRDVFDNHAPLFHLLSAPLLALLGERDNVLLFMRAPMIVLFLIVIAMTWEIARRFWSERTALWAVILLATFPPFFLKSLEYRTDNLWTAVWMLVLWALLRNRFFLTGLLLGIALCVSLKTLLLVITIAVSAVITAIARDETIDWRASMHKALVTASGFVIVPAIVAGSFAAIGAWHEMVFCVVRFNEFVTRTHGNVTLLRVIYPFFFIFMVWRAREIARKRDIDRTRFFLGVCAAMFSITLVGFWVLISPRDFLPIMPLFAISLAAFAVERMPERASLMALAGLALIFLVTTAYYAKWLRNGTREEITMIHQVLGLTRPREPLMDFKGETIYRRRPYYFIFEKIGRGAMRRGLLRDTIADAVVRERCYVAQADGEFWPQRARAFLNANFLDVGRLRVAGQWIGNSGTFTIAIPGPYAILDKHGHAVGALDGTPYTGPRQLAAGTHQFAAAKSEPHLVLWAPAFERGYSPFHPKDRDF